MNKLFFLSVALFLTFSSEGLKADVIVYNQCISFDPKFDLASTHANNHRGNKCYLEGYNHDISMGHSYTFSHSDIKPECTYGLEGGFAGYVSGCIKGDDTVYIVPNKDSGACECRVGKPDGKLCPNCGTTSYRKKTPPPSKGQTPQNQGRPKGEK